MTTVRELINMLDKPELLDLQVRRDSTHGQLSIDCVEVVSSDTMICGGLVVVLS